MSLRTLRGFSLVELMVALVLGILLSIGVISLFGATSKSNKVQTRLARLQENGRYALSRIVSDLQMGGAQYCSGSGGMPVQGNANAPYVDGLRAPLVYLSNLNLPDQTAAPAPAPPVGAPSVLLSRFFMRGYDCGANACAPQLPNTMLPDMDAAVGARARNADVLTVRYLSGRGWGVAAKTTTSGGSGIIAPIPTSTTVGCSSDGNFESVYITPQLPLGERKLGDFAPGDDAFLADCSLSQIFAVMPGGDGRLVPNPGANLPGTTPKCPAVSGDARLFDLRLDFTTVTYYLQIQADAAEPGRLVSVLRRRVDGNPARDDIIASGIERLDFRYGVEDRSGNTTYLTADQVDAGDAANCLPAPPGVDAMNDQGCLWRSVKSIDVHLLANSVDDMLLTPQEMAYSYTNGDTPPTVPKPPNGNKLPSDLPPGRMMRREFSAIVSLRNTTP